MPLKANKIKKVIINKKNKTVSIQNGQQLYNRKTQRGPVSAFGAKQGNIVSNTTSMPIAFDTIQGNVTFARVMSAVTHPREGIDGLRIVGCQPLCDIGTAAADTKLFVNNTLATVADNYLQISPDLLNGPLAAQANLHAKYVFRDILIEYVSTVATSQANSFCLSIDSDTPSANVATNFSTARQISPSITIPFRHDRAYLHVHYDGSELYWTESDTANAAGIRQTVQYLLNGWPNAAASGAVTYGYTNIYYVVDLYQSVQSRGFTFRCSQIESDMLKEYLEKLRLKERQFENISNGQALAQISRPLR